MTQYSVLMAVYYKDRPEWLRQAMDSMWSQTVVTEDFVLVCDGPLTESLDAVIQEEKRAHGNALHIVRLKTQGGLGKALNVGLRRCRHELVARMDSDDIAAKERCEKELAVFDRCKGTDLVSCTVAEFRETTENVTGLRKLPVSGEEITAYSKKRNPFNHPAVMYRKSKVMASGGYRERFHLFEDYDLWVRMLSDGCAAMNLEEPLLYMRTTADSYDRRGGLAYARDMLRFHRWVLRSGWSTKKDFLTGAVPHAAVCLLPRVLRRSVYRYLRRNR